MFFLGGWGPHWVLFRPSTRRLGSISAPSWATLAPPRAPNCAQASKTEKVTKTVPFKFFGSILALSWAVFGPSCAILQKSWAIVGPSCRHLGPSWGQLGPSQGRLRPSWRHFGENLYPQCDSHQNRVQVRCPAAPNPAQLSAKQCKSE